MSDPGTARDPGTVALTGGVSGFTPASAASCAARGVVGHVPAGRSDIVTHGDLLETFDARQVERREAVERAPRQQLGR